MKLSKKGMVTNRDVMDAVQMSIKSGRRQVVVFSTPLSNVRERVKVTSMLDKEGEFRIRIGRPNYRERQWLKLCKKAGCRPRRFFFPGTRRTAKAK